MIPNSSYCWITLLSGIQKEGPSNSLLIDGVPGFEQALSQSKGQEVVLEYVESGGILCHFSSRVLKTDLNLKMIWVECPEVIYRVQRRTFYRLKAPARSEITFRTSPEKEERAEVLDYSLGGVAILVPRPLPLNANDQLKDLTLRIPEEKDWFTLPIPLGIVRRVDSLIHPGSLLCGLEFFHMTQSARIKLARHISEKERLLIRKFGKNLALFKPF
jgi:c-di-GMP-binding flagellar brake protein YcgR